MKAKVSRIFQYALDSALEGDRDAVREYLDEYQSQILAVAKSIDDLKQELERLKDEHTAICVVYGAKGGAK